MLSSSKDVAAALRREKTSNRRLYKTKGKMGRPATLEGEGQPSAAEICRDKI